MRKENLHSQKEFCGHSYSYRFKLKVLQGCG